MRRIVATLDYRDTGWQFPGKIPGIRALLAWTIDSRVVDGGVPQPVMEILSRAFCRCAMLTFYWEPEWSERTWSERRRWWPWKQWKKPPEKGRISYLKPSSLWDVIRRRPTYSLLTTNHPELASDLFDNNGWTMEGQRVFLTPPDVFPALAYCQVTKVFRWSPHPHWIDRFPLSAADRPSRAGERPVRESSQLGSADATGLSDRDSCVSRPGLSSRNGRSQFVS